MCIYYITPILSSYTVKSEKINFNIDSIRILESFNEKTNLYFIFKQEISNHTICPNMKLEEKKHLYMSIIQAASLT